VQVRRPFNEDFLYRFIEAKTWELIEVIGWCSTPDYRIKVRQCFKHGEGTITSFLVYPSFAVLPGAMIGIDQQLKPLERAVVAQGV
jgi:hypothetical protein